MKRFVLYCLVTFILTSAYAQSPSFFKYQAVARDNSGTILSNKIVSFRLSMLKNNPSGPVIYSEIHQVTSNLFGLVDLEIGNGTPGTGDFGKIDWGADKYFIKIEIDPSGGTFFQNMGTSQFYSVPYALYARNVQNNNDADADSTNELQKIVITNNVVSLSKGGGTFTLPTTLPGDDWGKQTVVTDSTITGTGTAVSPLRLAQRGATSGQVLKWNGTTWKPAADDNTGGSGFSLPFSGTANTASSGFSITNTGTTDYSSAISGFSSSPGNLTYGVRGTSGSVNGTGVLGEASATSGLATGVYGIAASSFGRGVTGFAQASSGNTTGVLGISNSSEGQGIWGKAESASGTAYGVVGSSLSPAGYGVYGTANSASGENFGVLGSTKSVSGTGVSGYAESGSGTTFGVRGKVESAGGFSGHFTGGRFFIGGNVGIGTENPGAKLEVNGQVKITGGNPGSGKILASNAEGLASWVNPFSSVSLPFYGINSTDSSLFKIVNTSATSGEYPVGISGVSASASGTGLFGKATASAGLTRGVMGEVTSPDGFSGYFTGGRFYVNGNVGIGKFPSNKLDVMGDRIGLSNLTGSAYIALRTDDNTGFVNLYYKCANMIIRGSAPGENLLIHPGTVSKVGIRTWTPIFDLDVNGDIRATGSVYYGGVSGSGTATPYDKPDYVFGETYDYLTVEKVEDFVNREKHLPWVTSAKQERMENGETTNMTRMAFETLESVENLQLQIFEQQKIIRSLTEQNEMLVKENNVLKQQDDRLNDRLDRLEKVIRKN